MADLGLRRDGLGLPALDGLLPALGFEAESVPRPEERQGPVAIVNRALCGTGTVAKSIEIARALRDVGIPVELWASRVDAKVLARIPRDIPVIQITSAGRFGRSAAGEILGLARTLRARQPGMLLSGGKHFHLVARAGLLLSGRRDVTIFGGRASNTARRPGRGPIRAALADLTYGAKYAAMDFVIAVSPCIEREVSGRLGDHPPIHCIPNGVDIAAVRRAAGRPLPHRWLDDPDLPVLVSAGRLDPQKGHDTLLKAMAILRGDARLRLIIAGGGKAAYRARLESLANTLGIADRVDFQGFLDEPFALIGRGDLFILPSRWEGASNALLEALAAGLPVVATDCPGGTRDILGEDGRFGTLAPVDDPAGLARAIQRELAIVRDPQAQRARAEHFALGPCMDAYVRLIAAHRDAPVVPAPALSR